MMRWMLVCLAALLPLSSVAKEPAIERWTPVTEHVRPDIIANYAPMSVEQANQLLSTSRAALLYDRDAGFNQMPAEGFAMRSRRRMTSREGFEILPDPEVGWVVMQNGFRQRDALRLNDAANPPEQIYGVPSDVSKGAWRRLSPYNPVAVLFKNEVLVIQYVSVRVNDPQDPMQSSFWAYMAVGAKYRHEQVVGGDLTGWRPVLTMGGRRSDEPRLVYLPVDVTGALDTSRDGVMLRFSGVSGAAGDMWMTNNNSALTASAVKVHFGTDDSLADRLDNMPTMPRERYLEPGSPTDPLMLAPRTARDPLGAGVEARQFVFADLTLIDLAGHSQGSAMRGRWDGVDVAGWFGRGMFGITGRSDMVAGRAMVRMGRMRDTNFTGLGIEVGGHPGPDTPGRFTAVAVNGVMQTYRHMGREVFNRPLESGNRIRVGTTGVEYESSVGLRVYAKKGLVVTPSGVVGGRWSFREQRAFLTIGMAIEGTWNRNWFGKRDDDAGPVPPG